MRDPYLYEDVPVLRNKLDIRTEKTLDLIEAEQSRTNMMLLYEQGFSDFSPDGLSEIHRFLFGDIYDWAASIASSTSKRPRSCWQGRACGTPTMTTLSGIWTRLSRQFICSTGTPAPTKSL